MGIFGEVVVLWLVLYGGGLCGGVAMDSDGKFGEKKCFFNNYGM